MKKDSKPKKDYRVNSQVKKNKKTKKDCQDKMDDNPVKNLPTSLEKEDFLLLQLGYATLNNAKLQIQLAQQQVSGASKSVQELLGTLNKKYEMDSETDNFNLQTGMIERGVQ